MEDKNRTIFVVLIAVVIVVAVFSSFGLSFFAPETPAVYLPEVTNSGGDDPGGQGGGNVEPDRYIRVEVTPETVQDVIRTMIPLQPESYHRTVTVQTALGGGAMGTTTNEVWVDFGWTEVQAHWPSGAVEHTIVGEGKVYHWMGGDSTYKSWDGELRDANTAQRIPTYEDVLGLDIKAISDTGYGDKDGIACIYVETSENELGNRECYWISVENGLLIAAETKKGEEIVLSMSSGAVERPVSSGWAFTLPDGTELHKSKS